MEEIVVAGLGNPGSRYEETLHNVGFKCVERLALEQGWPWKMEAKLRALVASGKIGERSYHLIKPETFMNLSGEAVRSFLAWYKLPVEALVVVVDDADLPLGAVRFRQSGGNGGHNGLKSIEQQLGTSQFKRLRIGIGRDPLLPLADYVLKPQADALWKEFQPAFAEALKMLTMNVIGENR